MVWAVVAVHGGRIGGAGHEARPGKVFRSAWCPVHVLAVLAVLTVLWTVFCGAIVAEEC